jgi:hypothetical protein
VNDGAPDIDAPVMLASAGRAVAAASAMKNTTKRQRLIEPSSTTPP